MDSKNGSTPGGGDHLLALSAGYRVGHYTIASVLGEGGFGITYRARDETLRREVAIKEYLPIDLAVRDRDTTIRPRSKADTELYEWGLQRFVDEGRTLAALDAPGIVRVYDFIEANGTAYMVMELVQGESLSSRLDRGGPLPAAELTAMAGHLLQGLDIVHRAGYLHRDIKPANILIRPGGQAVLVDFGAARAARRPGTGGSRALTSVYTPGYAPPEQYAGDGSDQGPWTDLYAMAATFYEAMTGHAPPDATSRLMSDRMVPAREVAAGRYPAGFVAGIDAALALRRENRPDSVAAWLAILRGETTPAAAAAVATRPAAAAPAGPRKPPPPPRLTAAMDGRSSRVAPIAPPASIHRPAAPPASPSPTVSSPILAPGATTPIGLMSRPAEAASPPTRRPSVALYVVLGVLAALALGTAGWFAARSMAPTPAVATRPGADDVAARARNAEEAARLAAEARRLADAEQRDADEAKRRAVAAERLAADEARLKAEAEARLRDEAARRGAAERDKAKAEANRVAADDAARQRAADEAKKSADEAAQRAAEFEKLKAEDQRRRAEELARQQAAERARLKAEADRRQAEDLARQRAAEQARAKAEAERQAPQPVRPPPPPPQAPPTPPPPQHAVVPMPGHAADGAWAGKADLRTHSRTGACDGEFAIRGSASAGNWTGTGSNGSRIAMKIDADGLKPTRIAIDGSDVPAWRGDLRQLMVELRNGCIYWFRLTRQ